MAFARIGSSKKPMAPYLWNDKDLHVKGSDKITLIPVPGLDINEVGEVTATPGGPLKFKEVKDEIEIFHPVCPWYELHGTVRDGDKLSSGPVTLDILTACGIQVHDLTWTVHLENRKSFHMTLNDDDRIIGIVTVNGSDTQKKDIKGTCPENATNPLVPKGRSIPLGSIQVAGLSKSYPEVRIRITPPAGVNYGPTHLREKIRQLTTLPGYNPVSNSITDDWTKLQIPDEHLFLNDTSDWCTFKISTVGDGRTQPGLLFSLVEIDTTDISGKSLITNYSLGIIDDVSDGIITCVVKGVNIEMTTKARVVVCPQDFVPDRRHVVSLADNFKDRADHQPVEQSYRGVPYEEIAEEVQDLFDRIFETMNFMNLDIINQKRAFRIEDKPPFTVPDSVVPMPLTAIGRQRHRRFVALEVLETIMREEIGRQETGNQTGYPQLIQPILDMLNKPLDLRKDSEYKSNSHKKMPALMRGSDGTPMHLTRRQYEIVVFWIKKLKEKVIQQINLQP